MTKKSTNIGKILAGLGMLLLGVLAVYSLIPSHSTNSPDKNEEIPQKNGPKKKKAQEAKLSEHPVANSSLLDRLKSTALELVDRFLKGMFVGTMVIVAFMALVVLPQNKLNAKFLQENPSRLWIAAFLLAFLAGCLSDKWLEPHADKWLRDPRTEIGYIVVSVGVIGIIGLGFLKILTSG